MGVVLVGGNDSRSVGNRLGLAWLLRPRASFRAERYGQAAPTLERGSERSFQARINRHCTLRTRPRPWILAIARWRWVSMGQAMGKTDRLTLDSLQPSVRPLRRDQNPKAMT